MDYEKAYKEALERARDWYNKGNALIYADRGMCEIFPELAESGDERIRKRLLTDFSILGKEEWGGLKVKDICTWLERQGKQKPPVIDFKAKNWYVSKVDGKIHDLTYNPTDKKELKKLTQSVTKTSEQVPSLLDLKLMDCPLSVRTLNALRLWDKPTKDLTLRDLVGCTKKELLGAKNFGNTMLIEVEDFLTGYGLKLKKE